MREINTNYIEYIYDKYSYENRLTEITDSSDDTVATFSYDALGRRIEKIEYASGSPSSTNRFYYDGWRVFIQNTA
ncbi:MAG: RHS repeat protein [Sedimentisphaerales bacterium]|nr:RHS repeat protein [Sedimentisphaerales bacterium]